MVLLCHTALINCQSRVELVIPTGRGKKLANAENEKSNAQFQLQLNREWTRTKNLPGVIRAISTSRGWSKFAKTVCDRFKSKIRLLQLYRDGSETVWLLDLIALDADSVLFHML
jgi:hypothetical protein